MQILRTESYRSGITLSIGFSLLAKVIAFATSLALAAFFGTSGEMDVYLYAFFVATLVTSFITALNSAVIIPEAMRLAEQEGEKESREFVNFFLYAYAAAGLLIAAVLLPSPVAAFGFISRFEGPALSGNAVLLYASLPLFPLMLVSNFLVDVFASRKFFTVPMIASMCNNALVLGVVLLLHGRLGVLSALAGLCAAYAAQAAVLLWMMGRQLGWEFGLPSRLPSGRVLKNSLYAQASNLATALSAYVPMYLLSGFDRGTVSAMNYGRQAAEFPNNFITQQFSSVAGIKLNELFARRQRDEVNRVVLSSMKGLFFALVPMSLFGAVYAGEIVRVLFGRGAFGPESVAAASAFFRIFALLLPFYAANAITARVFQAAQKLREALVYQVIMNLLLAVLIIFFVGRYGALGYPAGLLAFFVLSLFAGGLLCVRYFPEVRYWDGALYLLKLAALDAAVLLAVHASFGRLVPGRPLLGTALAAAAYFGVLAWLAVRAGVNEDFRLAWADLRGRMAGAPGK